MTLLRLDKEVRRELNSLFLRRVVSSCNVQPSGRVWCAPVRRLQSERGLASLKPPLPSFGRPLGKS